MRATKYLLVTQKGNVRLVSGGKYGWKPPTPKPNELLVELKIEIPDKFFEKPKFKCEVTTPPYSDHMKPLTDEVIAKIQSTIAKETGMKIELDIVSS